MPIYKGKGNRLEANSFRPISLTSVICKVLGKLIVCQMRDYIEAKKLLDDCQHGFMTKKSIVTNLLACDVKLTNILNFGHSADLFLPDFARTYDKIDHNILLKKLCGFGIRGYLLKWFSNFLSYRAQIVTMSSAFSSACNIQSGVIQGSVVGPTFFNLFINDLCKVLHYIELFMFADVPGKIRTLHRRTWMP